MSITEYQSILDAAQEINLKENELLILPKVIKSHQVFRWLIFAKV